jgi:hypothetical protein
VFLQATTLNKTKRTLKRTFASTFVGHQNDDWVENKDWQKVYVLK